MADDVPMPSLGASISFLDPAQTKISLNIDQEFIQKDTTYRYLPSIGWGYGMSLFGFPITGRLTRFLIDSSTGGWP
jgi:hypothetical protein